jgi:alanine racemase
MRTWLEIDPGALQRNLDAFRALTKTRVMAVLKSNAYGHDLTLCAKLDADWIGVNSIEEAAIVRAAGSQVPLLVMGPVDPADFPLLASIQDCTVVLSSTAEIEALPSGQRFHLKVDTGMSRLGLSGQPLDEVFSLLASRPALAWTGLMTHFANVEDVTDQEFAGIQLRAFQAARNKAQAAAQGRKLLVHSAASGAAILLPESRMDFVRIGISLYGLWPSRETRISASTLVARGEMDASFALFPALTWKTRVAHLNRVAAGRSIGYGCTYRPVQETLVAVLPVGYFEGYDRRLSGKAHVLVRGQRAAVIGRVCMNMIMVDVTHVAGVMPGDEVVLIGASGEEQITAEDLAGWMGTINYEVVSRIEGNLPRLAVKRN